jgi:LysR family glycine cleavage system transcriptional activator
MRGDSPFPGELTIEEAHYLLLPRGRQRPRPEVPLLREWLLAQARS